MKKSNLMIAALAAAFTLASCSKSNDSVNPSGDTPAGTATMASVKLSQLNNGTYAPANAKEPTAAERKINTATLYVFNGGRMLEKIVPLTVDNNGDAGETFEITTGPKYFYAVVNIPNANLSGISQTNTSLAEFEEKIITVTSTEALTTNAANGFWMTNTTTPSVENLEVATFTEADTGVKNNFVISVGRAVAKVAVDFAPERQTGGQLSQVEYKVRQNPSQMYLMPVFNVGVLNTPYFADATVTGSYFSNPAYLETGTAAEYCKYPSYAIENANQTPKQGNATFVSIKGVFTPATAYDEDGQNGKALNEGEDFWRIKTEDGIYTDKYYFEVPTAAVVTAEGGANAVATPYPGGECYYALYLAKNNETNATAKYTVKRNTYYWITINSVNGAGESTEEGVIPEPEKPLEETTWMHADIEILDWVMVDQKQGI